MCYWMFEVASYWSIEVEGVCTLYVLPCMLHKISLADGQEIPLMEEGVDKLGC